jgi:2-methylcitrate dehydratase PrpD
MSSIENQFVAHLSKTKFQDLPGEAIEAARKCIIDTLGVIIAGSNGEDIRLLMEWFAERKGPEEATALVFGKRLPILFATWANGAMARAREFDDSHDPTGDHTSVPIFPAALATAELKEGVTGKDLLAAYVLAADFVSRLRLAPTKKVGSTSFAANAYAPFSAAVASGRILGLAGDAFYQALGWALSQCAGSLQLQQGGRSALHIHHGLAASTGVQAALLAAHGLPGVHDFLVGKFGLYNAYEGGGYNPDILTEGLGKRYEITQVSFKQYPSGRVTHSPIEAAIALRKEERLNPADIVEVSVVYTKGGYNMTCEPLEERRVPSNVQHAKFSLFYNVACALVRGHVNLEDFTPDAIADETVRNLAAKINVLVDPSIQRIIPPGIVTVKLKDGRELMRRVDFGKGTPENPVTFDDCAGKFRRCLAFAAKPLDSKKTESVVDLVAHLEDVQDIRQLAALLT